MTIFEPLFIVGSALDVLQLIILVYLVAALRRRERVISSLEELVNEMTLETERLRARRQELEKGDEEG